MIGLYVKIANVGSNLFIFVIEKEHIAEFVVFLILLNNWIIKENVKDVKKKNSMLMESLILLNYFDSNFLSC